MNLHRFLFIHWLVLLCIGGIALAQPTGGGVVVTDSFESP